MDPAKDPLFRGEFPVVLALLEKLKGGKEAKNECDKVIDKNGTPKTGGTCIKQLRENIAESKLSYEIMDDAAQAFLKSKIMDNKNLENLAKGDFKANLGKIIHDIYQTAHVMFADMPQGDHK